MVYIDYAATNPTPIWPCSKYTDDWMNPNANYAYTERRIMLARGERIKKAIGAKSGKVVFGGTASQIFENLMNSERMLRVLDYVMIGSAYEHDSVDRLMQTRGIQSLHELKTELTHMGNQISIPIVCWQGVNNVNGYIFDVKAIGELCHKHGAFYVCDMTAMIGHADIPAGIDNWCDCAFWSGHKIGTELGIGVMWLSEKFNNWLDDFKLHGTPNLAGAMAITDATQHAIQRTTENITKWGSLVKLMWEQLMDAHIDFLAYGGNTPAINAIQFPGINADSLQQYLGARNIYVGIGGSACASTNDFRVSNAFGLTDEAAGSVIRVSFGECTTEGDIRDLMRGILAFKETLCQT